VRRSPDGLAVEVVNTGAVASGRRRTGHPRHAAGRESLGGAFEAGPVPRTASASGPTFRCPGYGVIRVVVVDDQALVRMGLRTLVAGEDDIELVGEAADGQEGLAVIRRTRPTWCCWTSGCRSWTAWPRSPR
jgi:hypothetical protein